MLVLSRKTSQSIIIGNNLLKIKVLDINGPQVKIGIEAPENIAIHREEIHERIRLREAQHKETNNKKP